MNALAALGALAYLEWRLAVNRLKAVLHQPGRLVVWGLFVVWVLYVTIGRVSRGSYVGTAVFALPHEIAGAALALFPALYLALMGFTMARSTLRPPAAFAYPADSRFLCGSALPQQAVAFWLQWREFIGSGQRYIFAIIAMGVGFRGAGASLILIVLTVVVGAGLLQMLRLPVFLVAQRYPQVRVGLIGGALLVVGVAALVYPVYGAWPNQGALLKSIPLHAFALPPGSWLVGTALGQWPSLLALFLTALALAGLAAVTAGDCYPELWESSVRQFAQRVRLRSRLFSTRGESALPDAEDAGVRVRPVELSFARVPAGPWPIFWKDWLALRRSPEAWRGAIGFILVAIGIGAVFGFVARGGGTETLIGLGAGLAYAAVALSAQRSVTLAVELRKPMWWLSSVPLPERLATWTLSAALRLTAFVALGVVVAAVISGEYAAAGLVLALLPVFFWVGQSVGVAAYSIFPSKGDLRGPGALARMLACYLLFLPPIGIWVVLQFVFGQAVVVSALAACAWAVLEGIGLIWFASTRLAGNGMAFAWAEQR